MKRYYYYKKGDLVPVEIHHYTDCDDNVLDVIVYFGVDVEVAKCGDIYEIRPMGDMEIGESLIVVPVLPYGNDITLVRNHIDFCYEKEPVTGENTVTIIDREKGVLPTMLDWRLIPDEFPEFS